MKKFVTAAAIAALVAVPMTAQAKHKHKGMQGSPNAAGYTGKGGEAGGAKDDAAAGGKMKGPPNANGYEKK